MKKVLVIGGTGFIGMNIVENLSKHGEYVAIYDIRKSDSGYPSYVGDIENDENFDEVLSNFDTVIYLITTVSPKKSMENPELSYTNDIPLLIKTLDSCLKNNIKRVIFSSSGGTVYGDSSGKKSEETDVNEPINHYAICKLTSEKILEMYNKLYGMENISLRISNPFGKGQNPKSGVGAITVFANEIANGNSINIYGDGNITRDFIDVEEVAEGFYLATQWNFDPEVIPVFNIGSGQGISLNKIIDIIYEELNIKKDVKYLPSRSFDVQYNVLNISKAQKILNFQPCENEEENIKKYIRKNFK